MKPIQVLSLLAVILVISACGSDHDDRAPEITEFNQLVNYLIEQPSPEGEPVNINELTIEFNNNDENAFNSIL